MSIEQSSRATCDVCETEVAILHAPYDKMPDGWAWLEVHIVSRARRTMMKMLCDVCVNTIDNGGWPEVPPWAKNRAKRTSGI